MESLVNILVLLFRQVSSRDVLEGKVDFADFDTGYFTDLALAHLKYYSGNEAENLFRYLREELQRESWVAGHSVNVLDALRKFDELVLKEIEEIPVCRYRYLLKWRMVSFALEEELFTTSFLACRDQKKGRSMRRRFDWKYIIGNDNVELNNMLRRGIADNHYHLKGSAPYFYMSWINLMNYVDKADFMKVLRKYDRSRLEKFTLYHSDAAEESLELMHLQAALIRVYLFSWLTGRNICFQENNFVKFSQIRGLVDWSVFDDRENIRERWERCREEWMAEKPEEKEPCAAYVMERYYRRAGDLEARRSGWICKNLIRDISEKELDAGDFITERGLIYRCFGCKKRINLDREFVDLFINEKDREKVLESISLSGVEELLRRENASILLWNRDRVQVEIDSLRTEGREPFGNPVYDYMQNREEVGEEDLYGERWFLYSMFRRLYQRDPEAERRGNLFYAYLIIRERIRAELIQVNDGVGFDNFLRYQNRKEEFIDKTPLADVYSRHAVVSSFKEQPLKMLEARITPRNSAADNYTYIRKLDAGILEGAKKDAVKFFDAKPLTTKDFFYVFHFVKEPEKIKEESEYECRHYRLRKKVRKQAVGIYDFRFRYAESASRVYGIDACSPEIGCRPEIFGQAFRYLKYEQNFSDGIDPEKRRSRLRSTYHVGEDFLDIVDGMRAIDEAIYYLNLTHGDRLGHALALGVSPREWYGFKGNRVLCSRHDILDNTVWIYQKIRKYNISGTETIMMNLRRRFVHLFQEIYGYEAGESREECDIDLYYDAWKLRGDDPEIYYGGKLKEEETLSSTVWDEYGRNRKYPELERIRREQRCVRLYYRYHYDKVVKARGKAIVEHKIEQELIEVIEKIQHCLQLDIVEKGLAIETNPSSNYLIGTFRSYDKHPLMNWYNKKLTLNREELENCPQLDVTINTDDQAVFGTSLENEYALMAVALEKAVDEKGNPKYKKDMIYDWLENIRRNGFTRCFQQQLGEAVLEEEDGKEEWEMSEDMRKE